MHEMITAADGVNPDAVATADTLEEHAHGLVMHQFDSAEQQHDAVELGMWAFLATERAFLRRIVPRYLFVPFQVSLGMRRSAARWAV